VMASRMMRDAKDHWLEGNTTKAGRTLSSPGIQGI